MSEQREQFLAELGELFERYGIFISGRGHGRAFALVSLEGPHERPIDYPELDVVQEGVTFTTLGETYGYLDLERGR